MNKMTRVFSVIVSMLKKLLGRRLFSLVLVSTIITFSPPCLPATEDVAIESVEINGVEYPVPPPWKGNKIKAKGLRPPQLVQISPRLCVNSSTLYLLEDACKALVEMAQQAEEDGITLQVDSSYRSSWYQKKIFIRMMQEGRTFNDIVRFVAPPGYSEHALGTVVDFSPSNWRFAGTPAYGWLQEHAKRFGFFETLPQYPKKRATPWEAWHWRYSGVAAQVLLK